MMEKVDVNGPGAHQVYQFLKNATDDKDIKWNFGSYWLVAKDGSITRLEGLKNSPANFAGVVEKALSAD